MQPLGVSGKHNLVFPALSRDVNGCFEDRYQTPWNNSWRSQGQHMAEIVRSLLKAARVRFRRFDVAGGDHCETGNKCTSLSVVVDVTVKMCEKVGFAVIIVLYM
jgi:hypothetical protein